MADVEIEIEIQGIPWNLKLPSNIPTRSLIDDFQERNPQFKVPSKDAEGRQIRWRMAEKGTNKVLDDQKSLEENGVRKGHKLYLRQETEAKLPVPSESSKTLKRCDNGHFYEVAKHKTCPYCEDINKLSGSVRSRPEPQPSGGGTQRVSPAPSAGDPVTKAAWKEALRIDPVVGWFVCVHGPDKGRHYPILMERNSIGRDPAMDIAIGGDDAISRQNHAFVIFEPTHSSFYLTPGEGRGLAFLNDKPLLGAELLKGYDQIKLGRTKLVFVPFCGEHFRWTVEEPK